MEESLTDLLTQYRKFLIRRLQRDNLDFAELCQDYEECVCTLKRLLEASVLDENIISQYRNLKLDLENEILGFVVRAEQKAQPTTPT